MMNFKKELNANVATNLQDDMLNYQAPTWHIERQGTAGKKCYNLVGSIVFKDLESATKGKDIHISTAKEQMNFEKEGALRYTVFDPIPVEGTEHFVVINVAAFLDSDAHLFHKGRKDPTRMKEMEPFMANMQNCIMDSPFPEAGMVECADAHHFER